MSGTVVSWVCPAGPGPSTLRLSSGQASSGRAGPAGAGRLRADACEAGELHGVEQRQRGVPLDAGAPGVLGLQGADALYLEAAGRRKAHEAALAGLEGVDCGAVSAGADGLGVRDVVGDADGDPVVELEHLAELVAVGLQEGAGGAGELVDDAAGAAAHEEGGGLAADDLVEAVEGLGVGGGVAGDEGLLEELADGLGLELDDGGFEVLEVGAGGDEEVVDVGVAAHDLEGDGLLGEGGCGLGPGVADVEEGGGGW